MIKILAYIFLYLGVGVILGCAVAISTGNIDMAFFVGGCLAILGGLIYGVCGWIDLRRKVVCPNCHSKNITSCIGGSNLKPTEWEKEHIKYICMDCLAEFGEKGTEKEFIEHYSKEA